MDEIKGILGKTLIRTATEEEDKQLAADLFYGSEGIAVRCNNVKHLARFGDRFTMRVSTRCREQHELATEEDKILVGTVRYIFSCFVTEDAVVQWHLLCAKRVAEGFQGHQRAHGKFPGDIKSAGGDSFRSVKIADLPGCVIAKG